MKNDPDEEAHMNETRIVLDYFEMPSGHRMGSIAFSKHSILLRITNIVLCSEGPPDYRDHCRLVCEAL